jgi:prepilin-type N-terminal cleavage/methylation domain-containing protein
LSYALYIQEFHQMPTLNSNRYFRSQSAFSLVEMLLVLAVTALMSAIAVPVINGLREPSALNRATQDLAFFIEQSRAHAMAHSTHVWLGFGQTSQGHSAVFAFTSKDRTSNPDSDNLNQLGKLLVLKDAAFVDLSANNFGDRRSGSGVFSLWGEGRRNPPLVALPPPPAIVSQSTDTPLLRISPTGEIAYSEGGNSSWESFRWIEFGMKVSRGGTIDPGANASALQVAGLTGQVVIYRP